LLAPEESRTSASVRQLLDALPAESQHIQQVTYVNVNDSMRNGGGPACLRLRVPLTDREQRPLGARALFDPELDRQLLTCAQRHYRDRLPPADLADPALLLETRTALDELTTLLDLGSIYEFQGAPP